MTDPQPDGKPRSKPDPRGRALLLPISVFQHTNRAHKTAPVNFAATAAELRRQEFARLSDTVTPRIEALRSLTLSAFPTKLR